MSAGRVYLVRHAEAGEKRSWNRPDALRPLSRAGRRQADALVGLFEGEEVRGIVSSPATRCVQTVEPLAAARAVALATDPSLEVGGALDDVAQLVRGAAGGTVVCTHGEVLTRLLDLLSTQDGLGLSSDAPCAKGSVWTLDVRAGRIDRASYSDAPR